jgi:hypothetical protein
VGHADRVRVVTVLLVGLAGEPRPEQLDAADRLVLAIQPAIAPWHDRSRPSPADLFSLSDIAGVTEIL